MFLISEAHAQTAGSGDPFGGLLTLAPLVLIFAIFYFMIMRPQLKRQKEMRAMVAGLKKGDEVVTVGGLMGKITSIDENFVTLAVSQVGGNQVELTVQRVSVTQILPLGSVKF